MNIAERLNNIKSELPTRVRLVAVSKFHDATVIKEAYDAGQRIFGESRVQELISKHELLPKDIEWHFIGHLQANKIKYIVPFIDTIESVDSIDLLNKIDKQAANFNRKIKIMMQIHIAREEHKYGFSYKEMSDFFENNSIQNYPNLQLIGLMGMATFTDEMEQIRTEFSELGDFFRQVKAQYFNNDNQFNELSMGMSDDYPIAIEEGSSLIRVGSKIFKTKN